MSVRKQCELLGINRSSLYLEPQGESETNLELMRQIDEIYTKHPFYGCRKFAAILGIDKDHANRLMRKMGEHAVPSQSPSASKNRFTLFRSFNTSAHP